jgi:ABC-type transport system substrate-binding protein
MGAQIFPSSANPDSPWANLLVRKAASAAIDRDLICASLGWGVWTPLYQYTTPARPQHFVTDPDFGNPRYNPDQARAWMEEAGFADGFDTYFWIGPGTIDRDTASALAAMWEAVGIRVAIEFADSGAFTALNRGGWEGLFYHHIMNQTHHEFTARLFTRSGGWFVSADFGDTFEELYLASISVFGDTTAEVRAVKDWIYDNQLIIATWLTNSSTIVRPAFQGLNFRDNALTYSEIWLDPDLL